MYTVFYNYYIIILLCLSQHIRIRTENNLIPIMYNLQYKTATTT